MDRVRLAEFVAWRRCAPEVWDCFRPRLEPPLHDCFGGRTVRDSTRCFSVLLLRWQWGEQEWVESSLSDTGVVCSENLLNRTTIPTTSSVPCPPRAPEREQPQSQHEQLLVCAVRFLVETNIMQFCRLCPFMCRHCEMRPPRVHSSSMSSVPSATSLALHLRCFASRPNRHVVVLTISRAACRGGLHWFFPWSRCFCVYLRVTCMLRQERNPQANQYGGGPLCGEDTRAAGAHEPVVAF